MPFDWLHPKRVDRPQNRDAVLRRELEDRAALLYRLRFPRALARRRLLENLAWDFEIGAGRCPLDAAAVDAILDQTWKRGSAVVGGAPTV